MPTDPEVTATLSTTLSAQKKTEAEITDLKSKNTALAASVVSAMAATAKAQSDLVAAQAASASATAQSVTDKNALLAQIADLESQLQTNQNVSDALAAAAAANLAQAQANDALIDDLPVAPPVDPNPSTIYLRPAIATNGDKRQWYSEGLGIWDPLVSGDFSSNQGQLIIKPDDPTKIGVARVDVIEMSNGAPMLGAINAWNSPLFPDVDAQGSLDDGGVTLAQIGQPFDIARGYGRWSNAGLFLTEHGYLGSVGTVTAQSPWRGYLLPATKKVTAIAMTSGNELALVTTIDTITGKGELAVVIMWGGQDLKKKVQGEANGFSHDWTTAHPGLASPGIVCGMKLLGYIDLGLNAPSGVTTMTNRTPDRVNNKTDGNAGLLQDYDLSTQADRDSFNLGNTNPSGAGSNPNYVARSGQVVVLSQTENKAVLIDLTPFFAGVRTQYLTTQPLYDATKANLSGAYWAAYSQDETKWPMGFVTRPDLKPVVKATISVPAPTSALLHWNDDGVIAIGTLSGTLHLYAANFASEIKSLQLGGNISRLTYDRYQDGVRFGGFFALSKGTRTISRISSWDSNASVSLTIADTRIVDPTDIQVPETHGIDVGLLNVANGSAKDILTYRYTDYKATNFGGTVYPIKDGAAYECEGVFPVPGEVIAISTTNGN